MRTRFLARFVGVLSVAITVPASAQTASSLVGSWNRISQTNSAGKFTQPPGPESFAIFTADGFFTQIAIPAGRPALAMDASVTKEQVLAQVRGVTALRGTFTVRGDTLVRRVISHTSPSFEGTDIRQLILFHGDTLVLRYPGRNSKAEALFVRAR